MSTIRRCQKDKMIDAIAKRMFEMSMGAMTGLYHWPGDPPRPSTNSFAIRDGQFETISLLDSPHKESVREFRAAARSMFARIEPIIEFEIHRARING